MSARTTDFLVIGGGIVGISIARALRKRHPAAGVTLIEKEAACGEHASGRNSGVLHAGFYYSPESLKARFARTGNAALTEYCVARKLPILRCGKLVVAKDESELPRLQELHRRGVANGVSVTMLTAEEARELEPRAKTVARALWSPTTASVDPGAVMNALVNDARAEGVEILTSAPYRRRDGMRIAAGTSTIEAGFVVNAAGLYADTIARDFGFSEHYRILPFKGLYLYSDEPPHAFRRHLYSVPDPRFPFLGMHFTVTVDGHAKIGPTAIPALWREQYGGLSRFRIGEVADVASRGLRLLASDRAYRSLAAEELKKYSRAHLVRLASELATGVRPEDYTRWGKPGIRAQLYDTAKRALEMDFVIERDERSLHVLNAVSPGFTCALPFAEHVCDQIG